MTVTDSEGQRRGRGGGLEGGVVLCACLKTNHSSEMAKEIGMRVGGPSGSQVRGTRLKER